MSTLTLGELTFEVDAEGYMTDPNAWTKEIAAAIAADEGIGALTDRHWAVIEYARAAFARTGTPPTLRRITKESGVSTKEVYELFPGGPGKKVSRIAGLGKPQGCV